MEKIKDIKLSAKRGGNGYISSYTFNIGISEAKACGFVDDEGAPIVQLEKFIDPDNKEIVIRIKAGE